MEKLAILVIGIIIGGLAFSFFSSGSNFELPFGSTSEKASPSNWITEDQIRVKPDEIIIKVKGAMISKYANTNSMDPTLDEDSNGIEIPVTSPNQINPGDIITYERDGNLIVHRVNHTGYDKEGWYCITKGDNNFGSDGKIRFKDIRYITIGILY